MAIPKLTSFKSCIVEDDWLIDVWVNVDSYLEGWPGITSGPPDRWEPPEGPEIEFWLSWKKDGPASPYLEKYAEEEYDRFMLEYENLREKLLFEEEPYDV